MRDELTDVLRDLPGQRAGAGFTQEVLGRVDRPRRPKGRVVAAAVVAAFALTTALAVAHRRRATARAEMARELSELRTEGRAIRRELAALQELHRRAARTIYLGGTDQRDYVIETDITPARFDPAPGAIERRTP